MSFDRGYTEKTAKISVRYIVKKIYKRKLYYEKGGEEEWASWKIYYFFPQCKAQTLESILKDMAVIVERFYIV